MKKLNLFLTLSLAAAFSANATIITVSNQPNSPGQYTDVQDAIDAANSGDTLLVAGSAISYGSILVNNKAIHIIGSGYEPNKQMALPTTFYNVSFGYIVGLSSTGSSIEGCTITGLDVFGDNITPPSNGIAVTDIIIKRNHISQIDCDSRTYNILIYNNRIGGFSSAGEYTGNYFIYNNVITTSYVVIPGNAYSLGGNIVSNNLFLGGYIHATALALVYNNIFVGNNVFGQPGSNCTYNNNLSYCVNSDFPTGVGITQSGNIVNSDPLFVNAPGLIAGQQNTYVFDVNHDYNLMAGSPGINAGTDGTDIGIYGGSYPWPEGGISGSSYMYSQEANIPQVNEMDVLNSTVLQNGTLNVTVKGIINP